MRNTSRFEYKYLLSQPQYYALKNALMPYVHKDFYTARSENGRYLVRSLYYDTHDLKAFHERNDGQFGRIKCRLRVYGDEYNEQEYLSVEMKTKKGIAMTKYSSLVPLTDYQTFKKEGLFSSMDNPVLSEFCRIKLSRLLQPQLIVQYDREGFVPKGHGHLRLTFDHDVSSARAKTLFPDHIMLRVHRPKNVIFEIKCQQERPQWLIKIVKEHNLKMLPNSKYVQGIDIIRPSMVTPNIAGGLATFQPRKIKPYHKGVIS